MKTFKWKRLGFMLALAVILMGNLMGISALATEDGILDFNIGSDDPPAGVLKGYLPGYERIKTGEHIEYWGGWVGIPFGHLVAEYTEVFCCKRTNRAMDGCKGLKLCPSAI